MADRYTKFTLTIIAAALIALVFQLRFVGPASVHAQTSKPQQHCVWTFLTDQGEPNLGENGDVDLHDRDWKKMSDDGWQLKVYAQNGNYIFEKCE